MPIALPSASQLDRAFACPASLRLPRVDLPRSEAAHKGIVLHKYFETARADRAAALLAIEDEEIREQAEAIDISIIPEGAEGEVAFGWDPATDTGRRYDIAARGYPSDGLVHGTADLAFVCDGAVYIWDFKTGRTAVSASTWQLKFLALAACRYSGAQRAHVSILQLGYSGRWFQDSEEYEPWDLDEAAEQLRQLPAQAATADFQPGEHCQYCPSLQFCPAQTTLALAVVDRAASPLAEEQLAGAVAGLTLRQASDLWPKVVRAEALIDAIKTALKTRAAQEPLQLADGRTVQQVIEQRRSIRPEAKDVLVALRGAEAVLEAATLSAPAVEKKFGAEVMELLRSRDLAGYVEVRKVQAMGRKKKEK